MAIIDFFDRGWSIDPHGVAYIQDERSYSFTEVGEHIFVLGRDQQRDIVMRRDVADLEGSAASTDGMRRNRSTIRMTEAAVRMTISVSACAGATASASMRLPK